MKEKNKNFDDYKYQLAIELMEEGDDNKMLGSDVDGDVMRHCQDIASMARLLSKKPDKRTVEEELARFNKKHNKRISSKRALLWRTGFIAAASVAACVCLGIFFFSSPSTNEQIELIAEQNVRTDDLCNVSQVTIIGSQARKQTFETKKKIWNMDVSDLKTTDNIVTIAIPQGISYNLNLSDGTKVYISPGSWIVVPTTFAGDTREVFLEGEAYFMVAHDAGHPFIVKSKHMETKVLGTEFYMRANRSAQSDVSLIEGSVEVNYNSNTVNLSPGEQAVCSVTHGILTRNIDTSYYTHWRDGYYYFNDSSLSDVLETISKEYGLKVTYQDAELKNCRVHFVSEREDGIDTVINRLNEISVIKAVLKDKQIIIQPQTLKNN